jgi:hypothetical protein
MIRTAFAFLHNENLSGDYLEFGVLRGRTFVEAWHSAEYYGMGQTRFAAFDSFAGLPDPGQETDETPFRQGQFSAPRAAFEATLRKHHVPNSRTDIIEGFFSDTLAPGVRAALPALRAAVIWIDCDLYESTVPVLEYVGDVAIDGAVLIFDDWFTHRGRPDLGEQRACSEWLERHEDIELFPYRQHSWGGQSFILHRR